MSPFHAYTATVNGEVYGTDAINYILYGAIMRLCYDRYPAIKSLWWLPPPGYAFDLGGVLKNVGTYRLFSQLGDGSGYFSALDFAKVGWTKNWSYIVGDGDKYFAPSKIPFTTPSEWLHWQVAPSIFRGESTGIIDFWQGATYSNYSNVATK